MADFMSEGWESNTDGQGRGNNKEKDKGVIPLDFVKDLLKQQEALFSEMIQVAPNEKERQKARKRLDAIAVKLVRNFLVSDSREKMMTDTCAEYKLSDRVTMAINDKEVFDVLSEFKTNFEASEDSFKDSITDKIAKGQDIYVEHKRAMDEIFENVNRPEVPADTGIVQPDKSVMSGAGGGDDFVPTMDPVTQSFLIDPVKNSICGHVYGRDSILQLIASNNRARCPYPGCSSKEFVKKSHITRNKSLTKKIAKKVDEAKKRKDTETQKASQRRLNNTLPLDLD